MREGTRSDKREPDQLRAIEVGLGYLEHPAGSCLITMGNTRVLCAVTVENKVPPFLAGSGVGWLTAEYSMLPCATHERTQREAKTGRLSGRTQEIQRFIGRSLRPIFDLHLVGERTFIIDCDVIQADGGTRTTAVNGAFIALCQAVNRMMVNKEFPTHPIRDFVAGVSAGIVRNEPMLDLCYAEDSSAEIDMNLVMTGRGQIIEVQTTAEKMPVSRKEFNGLFDLAAKGISEIIEVEKQLIGNIGK